MVKVGICGFGYTGSGAVFDLLKEFSGVRIIGGQKEFVFSYFPDGLEDLEYHIVEQPSRFFSSDIAIMRFKRFVRKCTYERNNIYDEITDGKFVSICNNFINSITDISWQGRWMIDPWLTNEFYRTIKYRILGRLVQKNSFLYRKLFCRQMNFAIQSDSFYNITENLINSILGYTDDTNEIIAINQPFPSNSPLRSMRLFGSNTKAIIVDRDPRDLYILVKEYAKPLWIPLDNIDDYILYYKKLHLDQQENKDILRIQFEDLIFNYEKTRNQIMAFCNLSKEQHIHPLEFFNPAISLKNTRLFEKTDKYKAEIETIERQLPEFLFDFSRYSEIDLSRVDSW